MPTNPTPRAWLDTLGESDLRDLLSMRRDVLRGAPLTDLDDLADRLVHPATVAVVVSHLPLPLIQALEALAAAGQGASAQRAAQLMANSAVDGPLESRVVLENAVETLIRAVLVWPTEPSARRSAARGIGLSVRPDTPLAVNPGFLAIRPRTAGVGRPVALLVQDVPADALRRIVKTWEDVPVPTRKDELVETVRAALATPEHVRRVLASAPTEVAQTLLDRVSTTSAALRHAVLPEHSDEAGLQAREEAIGRLFDPAVYRTQQRAFAWAREHGIGFSAVPHLSDYTFDLELPSEVVLALLPPDVSLPFTPHTPELPAVEVDPEQLHRAACGSITDALALVMSMLELAERRPLTGLKSGGVGAREITRLARALGADPRHVRLAVELTAAADLLEDLDGARIATSARFGRWRRREPAERAAELLRAWFEMQVVPSLDRDAEGKRTPALLGDADGSPDLVRTVLLQELVDIDGEGATGVEALIELISWRLPYARGPRVQEHVSATWDEAHWLGVLALGAASGAGHDLLAGDERALVARLGAMLPKTQSTGLFGSDLTVIVPGSPAPSVVDLLDAVAVREARGSAATWRFTPESVRSALDDGLAAEDVLSGLRALASNGLPQAVEYLVRDVARRHGHVGVQGAGAVVVSEDPALLAEIAAHRALRAVGLRQVAPTVLVAASGSDATLAALRGAGYLPVPLDDGGARVLAVSARRLSVADENELDPAAAALLDDDADAALRRWAAEPELAPTESVADVVGRLLRRDPAPGLVGTATLEAQLAAGARRLTGSEVRQLAHAISCGEPVQMRYRSNTGRVTMRVVSDLSVFGPAVRGWCHLRQAERFFALGGILAIAPA